MRVESGLWLWRKGSNHVSPLCSDVYPCIAQTAEPQEQTREQDGGDWAKEDTHGHCAGCSGAAGRKHRQTHRVYQQSEGVNAADLARGCNRT